MKPSHLSHLWGSGSALAAILAFTLAAPISVEAGQDETGQVKTGQADGLSSYSDGRGNLVLQAPDGGAKIIRVGAARRLSAQATHRSKPQTASTPTITTAPRHPSVLMVVPAANTGCGSAIVVQGRSYMFGLDKGDTPVLGRSDC